MTDKYLEAELKLARLLHPKNSITLSNNDSVVIQDGGLNQVCPKWARDSTAAFSLLSGFDASVEWGLNCVGVQVFRSWAAEVFCDHFDNKATAFRMALVKAITCHLNSTKFKI